jgi:hypothetical protein
VHNHQLCRGPVDHAQTARGRRLDGRTRAHALCASSLRLCSGPPAPARQRGGEAERMGVRARHGRRGSRRSRCVSEWVQVRARVCVRARVRARASGCVRKSEIVRFLKQQGRHTRSATRLASVCHASAARAQPVRIATARDRAHLRGRRRRRGHCAADGGSRFLNHGCPREAGAACARWRGAESAGRRGRRREGTVCQCVCVGVCVRVCVRAEPFSAPLLWRACAAAAAAAAAAAHVCARACASVCCACVRARTSARLWRRGGLSVAACRAATRSPSATARASGRRRRHRRHRHCRC